MNLDQPLEQGRLTLLLTTQRRIPAFDPASEVLVQRLLLAEVVRNRGVDLFQGHGRVMVPDRYDWSPPPGKQCDLFGVGIKNADLVPAKLEPHLIAGKLGRVANVP